MTNINIVDIEDELAKSYLSYAMSVIIGRALPDARDGLKPVHRRILYGMSELDNYFDKRYKKSARIVGDVIGKYHPHGELAVYESIVRMVQSFVQRYNLIDGQGNFGSVDGDSPAAMRYTEIRLSEISNFMLNDLNFCTVDYVWNYDNTIKQPTVLPAILPNLLVNGASGIAVGMATNIPPHNIVEVVNACIAFIEDPNIDILGLTRYIHGPDFPTYGIICGVNGIIEAYKTGKGKVLIRAKACVEFNDKTGRENIIITELPYLVNKLKVIEKITMLIKDNKIDDIRLLRDESDKDGLRIFIELDKGKSADVVLDKLYSLTQLQNVYGINMVALVNGVPKLLNLKDIIDCFVNHRKEIVYRRTNFKFKNAINRIHILEGLCIALCNIDSIVDIIKACKSSGELKKLLLSNYWNYNQIKNILFKKDFYFPEKINCIYDDKYKFSILQIQSILDLKLYRLTRLERNVLIKEYEELLYNILIYRDILLKEECLLSVVKNELIGLKNKFKDKRRTIIKYNIDKVINRNLMLKKDVIVTLSFTGYIKFQLLDVYNLQHRGGKGKIATKIKLHDYLYDFIITHTCNILLCFSSFGKVYCINLENCSMSSRNSKGLPIVNLLRLHDNEKITVILPVKEYFNNKFVFMVTKFGFVKKILLTELKNIRVTGLIIIDLSDNDVLIDVKLLNDSDEVMLFASNGRALRFSSNNVRCTGRLSKGVIGMRVYKGIYIVSSVILDNIVCILTVVSNGYGKRTLVSEYPLTKRGGQGIIGMRVDSDINRLSKVERVKDNDELMIMTNKGILVRINVNEIPCISRNTKGVVLIRVSNDEYLVSVKNLN